MRLMLELKLGRALTTDDIKRIDLERGKEHGVFVRALLITFLLLTSMLTSVLGHADPIHFKSARLDPKKLTLASVGAMVMPAVESRVLYSKNADIKMPIASITKVMTAMVVLDAQLPLDERIEIVSNYYKAGKNAYSRIRPGSKLKRKELLRLALMSSENRAAATLGRRVPGGLSAFVKQMNRKAAQLEMHNTLFVDSTGLSTENVSTAADLARMVKAALAYPMIREYSTTPRFTAEFRKPKYRLHYGNTNVLIHRKQWEIKLSKTGYLSEAGRCLVMAATIDRQQVIMVLLDSFGKRTPMGDAGRIKRWLLTGEGGSLSTAAAAYEQEKSSKRLKIN